MDRPNSSNSARASAPAAERTNSPGGSSPAADRASELRARAIAWLRPRARQTLYNLRIWIPMLSNRGIEARMVRYWGRENRRGLTWDIELPEQCWKCGATSNLRPRQYVRDVRGFEQPVAIAGATLVLGAMFLLVFYLFPSWVTFFLLLATLTAGGVLLWVRSWTEEVRLTIYTSPEHEAELRCPDLVVDQNELYVFLPTATLAEATNQQLLQQRRRMAQDRGYEGPSASATRPPSAAPSDESPASQQHFGYIKPKQRDLPPIKLVDDEPPEPPQNG